MEKEVKRAIVLIIIAMILGPLLGFAYGIPEILAVSYLIQFIVYIPSMIFQSEKYFDFTGSMTYVSLAALSYYLSPSKNPKQLINVVCVTVWALRLGTFLLSRISKDGRDTRFDGRRESPIRFLATWTVQGLWVFMTGMSVFTTTIATDTNLLPNKGAFVVTDYIGYSAWVLGLLIEVTADQQKTAFKSDPANHGKFIQTGLWSYSRHPNYFGEILLWSGLFLSTTSLFTSWGQYTLVLSPLFVYLLLRYVSGVPLLEKAADKKWGDDAAYKAYKSSTPMLMLWPFKKN